MKGYKGFDKDFKCLGKQYKEKEVFEEDKAEICSKGMHFCESPFDVLDYYSLIDCNGNFNRFAEVEALEDIKTDDEKKFCTKKMEVGFELDLRNFIKVGIKFLLERGLASSGDGSQLASSGYGSKLASSGYGSKLASSGDGSQLASSGYGSQLASSGDGSQLASSGYGSKLASSGYGSKLASSGYGSQLASSGYGSQLASSGDGSQLASSGDGSQLASSGYGSKLASSGYGSKLASSGDGSQLASSGYGSQLASSGYGSKLAIQGYQSVGANIGVYGIIKGKKGSWITLAEYENDNGKYVCVCVKSAQIDGDVLKEDTFYMLKDGKFVKA